MRWSLLVMGAVLFGALALADDGASREKIAGQWQLQGGDDKAPAESWILESQPDGIHITQLQNGRKLSEFKCNTMGRECEVQDSGQKAKVSFWFSGPKLVQMETRGSEVVKRRFSTADEGEAMQVEVIPIVPDGKPVLLRFKRVPPDTAHQ